MIENEKFHSALFELLNLSIFDASPPNEECITYIGENIEKIYKLAKMHDLSHIIADAIYKIKLPIYDEGVKSKLHKCMLLAVMRYEKLNYELEIICTHLEKEKIYHIPLKGAVTRTLYREPWMRTSCDIDVLVHEQDLEKTTKILEENLGYEKKSKSSHDVSLFSPRGVNLELHFTLIEDNRINGAELVICDVWDYAYACEGYEYKMALKDEMSYFYHIAHMAKHFQIGGCGIKPFIDHKILNESIAFDKIKRDILLEKGGLKIFEEGVTHLCKVWFSNDIHTPISKKMEEYILHGGVYGSFDNRSSVEQIKHGGKLNYIKYKIWLPHDMMKSMYPILNTHKWLIPLCEMHRWGRLVLSGKLKRSAKQIKTIEKKSNEEISKTFEMMLELKLDIK